jgi:hypothetical protein
MAIREKSLWALVFLKAAWQDGEASSRSVRDSAPCPILQHASVAPEAHSRKVGGNTLETADIDRWAVPFLSILGALGLAAWSVYWDLSRRLPRLSRPDPRALPAGGGKGIRAHRNLERGLVLLASAWLMRYLSDRWGAWLAVAGYGAFVAGISLLALHLAKRLSALQRGHDGE